MGGRAADRETHSHPHRGVWEAPAYPLTQPPTLTAAEQASPVRPGFESSPTLPLLLYTQLQVPHSPEAHTLQLDGPPTASPLINLTHVHPGKSWRPRGS